MRMLNDAITTAAIKNAAVISHLAQRWKNKYIAAPISTNTDAVAIGPARWPVKTSQYDIEVFA